MFNQPSSRFNQPSSRSWTGSGVLASVTYGVLACVVALAVVSCGQSSNPSTPSGTIVTVRINANPGGPAAFSPSTVTIGAGQQVNWLNLDSIEHTATASGVFDTGRIAIRSAHDAPVMFNTPGTYTYHCSIHPAEGGTIVVQ